MSGAIHDNGAIGCAPASGLQVRDVHFAYGEHAVLRGVDLFVPMGEIHGLVGRNGAGKSTLLASIAGLVRPGRGTITVNAEPVRIRDVGYLPVESHFYSHITGREYLSIFSPDGSRISGRHDDWVETWGRAFDLPLDALLDDYSSGMRQKLAILGVLRLDRRILLLDEPVNGLDLESNQLLTQVLRALAAAGVAVLATSHVLEALWSMCDRVHMLDGGVITGSYAAADFAELRDVLVGDAARRLQTLRPHLR